MILCLAHARRRSSFWAGMEVNRDEARRCLDIGIASFEAGDTAKAVRFFKKSQSMFPTDAAAQWIEKVTRGEARARGTSNTAASPPTANPREEKPVTDKQKRETERILREKDYYKVLGCARGDSSKVYEKAYRKV